MADRFDGLIKIPNQPAARMLAMANARLGVKLDSPASAPVPDVLRELEAKNAEIDMMRMLSVALPPRERVWWACRAARDIVAVGLAGPAVVEAAEAWVREPGEARLVAVRRALDAAEPDDDTALAGMSAMYAGGKLGPEELAEMAAPPGGAEALALGANIRGMAANRDRAREYIALAIDRALDIARGGGGDLALSEAAEAKA